jgi:hypothetical protein
MLKALSKKTSMGVIAAIIIGAGHCCRCWRND